MNKPSLGDRMKSAYEEVWKIRLPLRMPVIIRLDGRAFHTLTRKAVKPFDSDIITMMQKTAQYVCEEIQGAQIAYIQSDEISILVHNYKKLNSGAWFNNEVQKMCSISAALASSFFTYLLDDVNQKVSHRGYSFFPLAQFDSRVFVLPENEVCNLFIWRQQDWTRNSIEMLARSLYSHKECHKKNNADLQEMCFQKGQNWSKLPVHCKRGSCVYKNSEGKWCIDDKIPVFSKDRNFIEKYLKVEED